MAGNGPRDCPHRFHCDSEGNSRKLDRTLVAQDLGGHNKEAASNIAGRKRLVGNDEVGGSL